VAVNHPAPHQVSKAKAKRQGQGHRTYRHPIPIRTNDQHEPTYERMQRTYEERGARCGSGLGVGGHRRHRRQPPCRRLWAAPGPLERLWGLSQRQFVPKRKEGAFSGFQGSTEALEARTHASRFLRHTTRRATALGDQPSDRSKAQEARAVAESPHGGRPAAEEAKRPRTRRARWGERPRRRRP